MSRNLIPHKSESGPADADKLGERGEREKPSHSFLCGAHVQLEVLWLWIASRIEASWQTSTMPPTATPRDLTHYTKRGKVRQRANVACTRCHHRRIKCSASVTGLPCDGCRQSGQGTAQACQIAVSGRSDRSSTHLSMAPSEPSQSQSPVQALGYTPQTPQTPPTSRSSEARSSITVQDDSNNLYAQILDSSTEPGPSRAASSSAQRPTSSPQVVYLGETFNLTHLLYTTNPHARRKAHGYHRSMAPSRSATRSSILSDETLDILHRQRAFELPPSDVIKDLYRAYFDYAYPHNPILSRVEFARAYSDPQIRPPSYLLLQSVLFAAVGHCDISVIKRAGYNSRYQARAELFKRAKALYDADHETNKVTLVQSLFLMSAWWSSPTDQKDTWHWLGAAIGLAVTMGMHRSTADSILPISDQRLWRRIWWALYTEDKHASIALGRPVHLRLRDCDVEPLAQTDLEEETLSLEDQAVFGATRRDHTLYVIHLSELSKIVERIIDSSRSPLNCSTADRMASLLECENLLRAWTENVPMDFRLSDGLWQRMLFAAHSWVLFASISCERRPTS